MIHKPPKPPGLVGASGEIIQFAPKPAAPPPGEGWTCALDMLKELIRDIESGEVAAPELIYVAMQTRDPNNPIRIARPAYNWFDPNIRQHSQLLLAALLEHHKLATFG